MVSRHRADRLAVQLGAGVMAEAVNLSVPFFSQRSNRARKNTGETTAEDSCNLTSLCMILNYLGITDDTPDILIEKFMGKKYKKDYTHWDYIQKACTDLYGIEEERIRCGTGKIFKHINLPKLIQCGVPVMFSYGVLSSHSKKNRNYSGADNSGAERLSSHSEGVRNYSGHIAVLRGMTDSGDWILNDPWGDPSNAHGLLNQEGSIYGVYGARKDGGDITAGKGSGDNVILSSSEISKVCSDPPYYAMCILWASQWAFFLRDSAGKRIRSGDKDSFQTLLDMQSAMKTHLNFVLSENGAIAGGLRLSEAAGKKVYSCGPGRIIAIRNTAAEADNFILVMHTLPGKKKEKVFMLYKGLAYVDLNDKIEEGVYSSENSGSSWHDQLVSKIHTKAVIYDTGSKSKGLAHQTGLPERGTAYLFPENKKLKDFAEHIEPGSIPAYKDCAMLDDINNYKSHTGDKISFKIMNPETGIIETKASDSFNLVPQTLNIKEYRYYRTKLAQLLSGKSTVFLGEDDDTVRDLSKTMTARKDTFEGIFLSALKDVFNEIDFEGASYSRLLDRVSDAYQKKIRRFQEDGDSAGLERLASGFVSKCRILCRKLLETPWTEQTYAFSYKDNWYKGKENGDFAGLKQVYENVYALFQNVKSAYDFGTTWAMFEESVRYFYPANMDFFLEATSGTVLGEATKYSSIQCFSCGNIFDGQTGMKVLSVEKIYKKPSVVSSLKKARYFDGEKFSFLLINYIQKAEIKRFYEKFPFKDLDYILHIQNPLKKLTKKKQNKIASDAIGNIEVAETELSELMFSTVFDKNFISLVKKNFKVDFSSDKLYFYNPVKMISCLYELQNEQIKKIEA